MLLDLENALVGCATLNPRSCLLARAHDVFSSES
jgi:hypothetical protein